MKCLLEIWVKHLWIKQETHKWYHRLYFLQWQLLRIVEDIYLPGLSVFRRLRIPIIKYYISSSVMLLFGGLDMQTLVSPALLPTSPPSFCLNREALRLNVIYIWRTRWQHTKRITTSHDWLQLWLKAIFSVTLCHSGCLLSIGYWELEKEKPVEGKDQITRLLTGTASSRAIFQCWWIQYQGEYFHFCILFFPHLIPNIQHKHCWWKLSKDLMFLRRWSRFCTSRGSWTTR